MELVEPNVESAESVESVESERDGQGILCRKATADDLEKIIPIDIDRRERINRAVLHEECYVAVKADQVIGYAQTKRPANERGVSFPH
ncbi:MAG: hypothetical protein ACOX8I_06355 [Bacillota bacterium]|jgi:hypothetical protein